MRRKRESTAKGHGSPPLLVKDVAPVSHETYGNARRHEKKGKKVVIVLPNVKSVKNL